MKYFVTLPSGRELTVEIVEDEQRKLRVAVDGRAVDAQAIGAASNSGARVGRTATAVHVDGRSIELWLEGAPPRVGVIADGQRFFANVESERMRIQAAAKPASSGESVVKSPMPGRVVRVLVAEGDSVEAGAAVVVVEAMKMENELAVGRAGKVKRIATSVGATVEGGAVLLELE
jgi:biotin carboxyl carrier protein